MKSAHLRAVFDKTHGHCHFCGDELVFERYHDGEWELDHVIQRKKGGASDPDNYLPACKKCNHLRWHRKGEDLREVIFLGLIAKAEIKAGTRLGHEITAKRKQRLDTNDRRRSRSRGQWKFGDSR